MNYPVRLSDGVLISGVEALSTLNRINEDTVNGMSAFFIKFDDGITVNIETPVFIKEEAPDTDGEYEVDPDDYVHLDEYEVVSSRDLDFSFFEEESPVSTHELLEFLLIETLPISSRQIKIDVLSNNRMLGVLVINIRRGLDEDLFHTYWQNGSTVITSSNIQHIMAMIMGIVTNERTR